MSIQGESSHAGRPCVMVRLTGCNLRCSWCDTTYAYEQGDPMSLGDVLRRVAQLGCKRVEVTGGEPLTQPATPQLLRALCDAGCETLLETNGSIDISPLDPRVVKIVDFKCPSSGQTDANMWANLAHLSARDEVKFVIADRDDYLFAREAVGRPELRAGPGITFSPVHGKLPAALLAEWILADGLDVRLGVQLHRIIWPDEHRGK